VVAQPVLVPVLAQPVIVPVLVPPVEIPKTLDVVVKPVGVVKKTRPASKKARPVAKKTRPVAKKTPPATKKPVRSHKRDGNPTPNPLSKAGTPEACFRGHPKTLENTYTYPNGTRKECLACKKTRDQNRLEERQRQRGRSGKPRYGVKALIAAKLAIEDAKPVIPVVEPVIDVVGVTPDAPPPRKRIETGSLQFGSDWAGVFIRGDNAFAYAMALQGALEDPTLMTRDVIGTKMLLQGLVSTLSACIGSDPPSQHMKDFDRCLLDSADTGN
jgi:hypothetical protein